MNPQFYPVPPLPIRPKFVPVIVQRPTAPLHYKAFTQDQRSSPPVHCVPFTQDQRSSPPVHGVPLFPFGPPPEVTFNSPTMSKTCRRELVQLGSPKVQVTELVFELAALKNGIRIGVDHNKGTVKQVDSLETFKKNAERNGITVCPPGSKIKAESVSTYSSAATPPPDDSRNVQVNQDWDLTSVSRPTQWDGLSGDNVSHSSVGEYHQIFHNLKHVIERQNAVTALRNGAPFQVVLANEITASTDTLDIFKNKAAKIGIKVQEASDSVVNREENDRGTRTMTSEGVESEQSGEKPAQSSEKAMEMNDLAVGAKNPELALGSESFSESDSELEVFNIGQDVDVKKTGLPREICGDETTDSKSKIENLGELPFKPGVSQATSSMISLMEDEQIAAFEEMARQNGIKVSRVPSSSVEEVKGNIEATDNTDIWHRYLDWLDQNEIEDSADVLQRYSTWLKHTCNEITGVGEKNTPSGSSSESDESVMTENVQEPEYWTDSYPFEEDPELARFQELARLKGIKVSVKPLQRATIVYSQASTQTEISTVDCHSQTCEKDHGLFKHNVEVQVDAVKEAFEEEFVRWKLDENATGDSEELCYKGMYFEERKAREELTESLHNEKDVSANTKHNHKRVMEQLKEELSSKTEETEKLKKDLKTLKRHKDTEIKRITKELDSTKVTLQLKEVALESLRSIVKDQEEQRKTLEEQLEKMKTALMEVNKNAECKTCLSKSGDSKGVEKTNLARQNGDGWTIITGKKSKSPKPQRRPSPVNTLCDIDLCSDPTSSYRESTDCNRQDNSLASVAPGLGSPRNGESRQSQANDNTGSSRVGSPVGVSASPRDIPRNPRQDSSCATGQSAEATRSPPGINASPPLSAKAGEELRGIAPSSSAEEQPPAQNASGLCDGNNYPQHMASNAPNVDITTMSRNFDQEPLPAHAFYRVPPFHFPGIPLQVINQYLNNLVVQPNFAPENRVPPLRRPPGLNTEPVPQEEPVLNQPSPPTSPGGKSSSFEKLMDALHKRFPNKDRQELIIDLKKAKAASGAAGFKGKQIADVVKCVEDVVKDKEEDN